MNVIAAVDKNWAIGYQGELLMHIAEDMKFFRKMTTGKVVIMGRATLESFPDKKPLKNRINIVITKNTEYEADGAVLVHTIEEAIEQAKQYAKETKDIFVIGGGSIYQQMLPFCDKAYITCIEKEFEADTYFPNLHKDNAWQLVQKGETLESQGISYCFCTYEKNS